MGYGGVSNEEINDFLNQHKDSNLEQLIFKGNGQMEHRPIRFIEFNFKYINVDKIKYFEVAVYSNFSKVMCYVEGEKDSFDEKFIPEDQITAQDRIKEIMDLLAPHIYFDVEPL